MHFIYLFHIICIGSYSTLILPDVSNNEGVVVKKMCSMVITAALTGFTVLKYYVQLHSLHTTIDAQCFCYFQLLKWEQIIWYVYFLFEKTIFWWRGKIEEHTQDIASCTWISLKSPSLELPCKYWKDFPSPPPRWNRWVRDRHFSW